MAQRYYRIDSWIAGISSDNKVGPANSFSYGQSVDFRSSPSKLGVLPRTVKETGSTVVTEIKDGVRVPANGGDTYWAGTTKIYKRVPASAGSPGTWSVFSSDASLINANSALYRNDTDSVYIGDSTTIHRISPMSGTPAFEANKFAQSLDQSRTGGALTYTLPTSISESATAKLSFTPTIEPLYSVKLYVVAKGTGDVTVTVHDEANNVIGSKTLTNANLTNGVLNEFVFATPLRVLASPSAKTYHIHAVVTTGTTTVQTATASDFSTANYETYGSRLVGNDAPHPMINFLQYICIGNERYLSVWEPLSETPSNNEWLRHRLVFPPEYTVIGLALWDEYIAIATFKNVSSDYGGTSSAIPAGRGSAEGIIFFWNGTSSTYDFSIPIPEGAPESLYSYGNVLQWIANGRLYNWSGGVPQVIREIPKVSDFLSTQSPTAHEADVFLQAAQNSMVVNDGLLLIGYPRQTVNENLKIGVYSYGTNNQEYSPALGYDYVPSHGATTATFANSGTPPDPITGITDIEKFGANVFIAWKHSSDGGATTSYGVDVVNNSNSPFASASFESMIFDDRRPWKQKLAYKIITTTKPIPAGATVTPKYRKDRATNFTTDSGVVMEEGETVSEMHIQDGDERFYEFEIGFNITAGNIQPEIISQVLVFDPLRDEQVD